MDTASGAADDPLPGCCNFNLFRVLVAHGILAFSLTRCGPPPTPDPRPQALVMNLSQYGSSVMRIVFSWPEGNSRPLIVLPSKTLLGVAVNDAGPQGRTVGISEHSQRAGREYHGSRTRTSMREIPLPTFHSGDTPPRL